ncbi:MAG: SLBB domain-containing protein [Campylobacterota bacterium]|nr:SLBB domain-containing protein [Campylobacterota bacterium]
MLNKILILVAIFFTQFLFSAETSQANIINAVKANPSLLNTPQAQQKMAQMGVDKSQVLNKINISNNKKLASNFIDNDHNITNNINFEDNNTDEIIQVQHNKSKLSLNPLEYKNNDTLLRESLQMQANKTNKKLTRYGLDFFKNKNNIKQSSLPVPSYYIINKDDSLSIWMYGATNETLNLKVDNNGNINIPKVGPIQVVGKTYNEATIKIKSKLKNNYPNTSISMNITNYSTIQVNLVGEVSAPGVYNISSLSTVKNLLISAHGIKSNGSLRDIIIKRDGKILAVLDFYKLLRNGDDTFNILLKSGDTVFIPKSNKIISIDGSVVNPAKYELKNKETLSNLFTFSGGLTYNGSKHGFLVKRVENNENMKTFEVDLNDASNFQLQDGDKVYVYKVDKIHNKSIYLYGNVVRPGERAISDTSSLSKLLNNEIKKVSLNGVFLENTLFSYAMIKRKTQTLEYEIINFNLNEILENKKDILLKNNDKIYIFNKYNSDITPYVIISGPSVIKTGKYNFYSNMQVRDLINIAGTTPYTKIKLTTYNTENMMPFTKFVDLDYKLSAFDEIELFDYYMTNKINTFNISGEINLPNTYSLNNKMSLLEAVDLAGGFTNKAFKNNFEVIRYEIINNERVRQVISVNEDNISNFYIKNYDEIKVFRIPNWYEKQTITLKGEVKFPGVYTIQSGERLSSLINRAGGFTSDAFIEGAVFTRERIKLNEQKRMNESMHKIKQQLAFISTNGREAGTQVQSSSDLKATVDMLEKQTKEYKAIGRLVIYLNENIEKFENSEFNIKLEDKDTLTIPSINDTISIYGEVLNPNTFVYNSSLNSDDYINKAGGITQRADDDFLYIVQANGEAKSLNYNSWFNDKSIQKGSTIIVPMKINSVSNILLWKDISQIIYQLAITTASLSTVGAI